MSQSNNERCRICGHPKNDHHYRHAFVGATDSPALIEISPVTVPPPSQTGEQPASVRASPPGDSVLRLVLLRSGVITLEDIEKVEAELRGAGVAYHDPKAVG